jgi:hypothetical protein
MVGSKEDVVLSWLSGILKNCDGSRESYHNKRGRRYPPPRGEAEKGGAVRKKTEVAQVNEMLLKVLCHNICAVIQEMFELGIEPSFFSA